jgi:indolepyruvate ferredoxin oxidoreductase, beta subunit
MKKFNIYLTGVGGQGIGLISEILLRAADYAGLNVKSVDTHGLAQRGGIVVSQIRMGRTVYTPLIPAGESDLVVALERHEALRGMISALKDGGVLIYYNTVWQPIEVRLENADEVTEDMISHECQKRDIKEIRVFEPRLKDIRMQNIAVLADIARLELIPGINHKNYVEAMKDLMESKKLEDNMKLFNSKSGT